MRIRFLLILLVATVGLAKPISLDLPVTTTLADSDATGTPYDLQSDRGGAYSNGLNGVISILVANGYNRIVDGDWRLDTSGSTARSAYVTLDYSNEVTAGHPGYQAPPALPWLGAGAYTLGKVQNMCTADNHNMLTMLPGDTFPCSAFLRFPGPGTGVYKMTMGQHWYSETTDVQVTCNSADSQGCKDWFIDPFPLYDSVDGTTSRRAIARLEFVDRNKYTDDGDFYLTFHIHVTRP